MDVMLKFIFVLSVVLQLAKGDNEDIFLTQNEPFNFTCKSAPDNFISGYYYVGPPLEPFKVYCNMTTKETCLVTKDRSQKTSEINYTAEKANLPDRFVVDGPFWLSELGVNLTEIYNITKEQLKWFQDQSSSVRQTLTYRCYNTAPYSETNTSISIQLLSWNNVVIGPRSTNLSSTHYDVPLETHRCKGLPSVSASDIQIQSTNVFDLPVKDIQIRDIRNEFQAFRIDNQELCFT